MLALLPVALSFLKTWWKVLLPVLLLAIALGYVANLKRQIGNLEEEKVVLLREKAEAQSKEKDLALLALHQSKKYERSLEETENRVRKEAATKVERIKKDEESKRIALTANLIELFNSTKPAGDPVTTTERADDGKAAPDPKAVTLNDLLIVSATNDTNHQVCIETVDEWQRFWTDYKNGVAAVGGD